MAAAGAECPRRAISSAIVAPVNASAEMILCGPNWLPWPASRDRSANTRPTGSGHHRPRWRRALRRSKLVVLVVDELGRIEGIVVVIIEGVRADIERFRVLLQLLQLLDDLAPHLLRHRGLG